jgi:hypothetical protein
MRAMKKKMMHRSRGDKRNGGNPSTPTAAAKIKPQKKKYLFIESGDDRQTPGGGGTERFHTAILSSAFRARGNAMDVQNRAASVIQYSWRVREKLRRMRVRQRMLKKKIHDIVVYVIFLVVYTIAAIIPYQDEDRFYFVDGIKGQFVDVEFGERFSPTWGKSMKDVATVEEMYQWAQSTFFQTVYGGGTFDGEGGVDTSGFILGYGKVVGGVRIGQFRVRAMPCKWGYRPFMGSRVEQKCYGKYSAGKIELTEPFGDPRRPFLWSGWNGTDTAKERATFYSSQSTPTQLPDRSFPTPAYSIVLPNRNGTKAKALLKQMIEGRYVDLHTKAVFFDVNIYNAMLGVIVQCRMMFVITQSGGAVPAFDSTMASTVPLPFMAGYSMYTTIGQTAVFLYYFYFVVIESRIISKIGVGNYFKYPESGRWIHM